jgi:hypothetical protein
MAIQDRVSSNTVKRQAGYFCHLTIDKRHMGGVLVTNQLGVPVEFKYTEPITTTRLHSILYGASLERYIHETVIRDRLSREIRAVPDYFITPYSEKEFLGSMAGKEMMAVQSMVGLARESTGPFIRIKDRELIVELEDGPSLRIAFSTPDDSLQRSMITWLQELSRSMDLLEPIERVANALNMLCGEEKRS